METQTKTYLSIENFDHTEPRFRKYLDSLEGEKIIEFKFSENTPQRILEILTNPKIDELCFESLFQNRQQLIQMLGLLIKFKDKINFRTISILYSTNEFEIFLNILIKEEPEIYTPLLKDLFSIYKIYAIEYKEYENPNGKKGQYFKNYNDENPEYIFFYDRILIEQKAWSDGAIYFAFERSTIIDPRSSSRSKKLYPFDPELLNGLIAKDFFNEIQAFLEYQKECIEDGKEPDKAELLSKNESRQIFLSYIKLTFAAPIQ